MTAMTISAGGSIDMSYVEIGSRMYIEYDVNSAGHARFLKAELID